MAHAAPVIAGRRCAISGKARSRREVAPSLFYARVYARANEAFDKREPVWLKTALRPVAAA